MVLEKVGRVKAVEDWKVGMSKRFLMDVFFKIIVFKTETEALMTMREVGK